VEIAHYVKAQYFTSEEDYFVPTIPTDKKDWAPFPRLPLWV
jgi:hypothetical protein